MKNKQKAIPKFSVSGSIVTINSLKKALLKYLNNLYCRWNFLSLFTMSISMKSLSFSVGKRKVKFHLPSTLFSLTDNPLDDGSISVVYAADTLHLRSMTSDDRSVKKDTGIFNRVQGEPGVRKPSKSTSVQPDLQWHELMEKIVKKKAIIILRVLLF